MIFKLPLIFVRRYQGVSTSFIKISSRLFTLSNAQKSIYFTHNTVKLTL